MICKNCGKDFKSSIMIDGKRRSLNNRKYCLECSPFGQHNTKNFSKIAKQNTECICKRCRKPYIYQRHRGMTITYCAGCRTTIARHKLKQKMINYKGGKCKKCGYDKCKNALCFHHVNDKEKEISLSLTAILSWTKIQKELDKCEILCANCHMEVHERLDGNDKIIQMIKSKKI